MHPNNGSFVTARGVRVCVHVLPASYARSPRQDIATWSTDLPPSPRCFVSFLFLLDATVCDHSDDGSARLWHVTSPSCVKTCELGTPLRCCKFSPDGSMVVLAGKTGKVFVLSPDLEQVVRCVLCFPLFPLVLFVLCCVVVVLLGGCMHVHACVCVCMRAPL